MKPPLAEAVALQRISAPPDRDSHPLTSRSSAAPDDHLSLAKSLVINNSLDFDDSQEPAGTGK
jgi:hypothetical protein